MSEAPPPPPRLTRKRLKFPLDDLGPVPPSWRDPTMELDKRIAILLEMIRNKSEHYNQRPRLANALDLHMDSLSISRLTPRTERKLPRLVLPAPIPTERTKKHVKVARTVQTLGDIVSMIENNPLSDDIVYDVNMERLHAAAEPLQALNNMVGLNSLKSAVCDQIIYYLQGLHEGSTTDYMHTVIAGPPGTGKTEVAKLMGGVFSKIGVLEKGSFKKVTRSDMVAGYLGQTAIKTKKLIDESIGGVLFIDEAYALGNTEQKDSYSKECLDTLCEALSDHKNDLMVIIAGYADQLESCFFNYNEGLRSRFAWRFQTDTYSAEEMCAIFEKKACAEKWTLSDDVTPDWFSSNSTNFKYAGRDVETLFSKAKIAHSRRLFANPDAIKKSITREDLTSGFSMYKDNYSDDTEDSAPIPSMYL